MSFFEKVSELVVEHPYATAAVVGCVGGVAYTVGYYSCRRETLATIDAMISEQELALKQLQTPTELKETFNKS